MASKTKIVTINGKKRRLTYGPNGIKSNVAYKPKRRKPAKGKSAGGKKSYVVSKTNDGCTNVIKSSQTGKNYGIACKTTTSTKGKKIRKGQLTGRSGRRVKKK